MTAILVRHRLTGLLGAALPISEDLDGLEAALSKMFAYLNTECFVFHLSDAFPGKFPGEPVYLCVVGLWTAAVQPGDVLIPTGHGIHVTTGTVMRTWYDQVRDVELLEALRRGHDVRAVAAAVGVGRHDLTINAIIWKTLRAGDRKRLRAVGPAMSSARATPLAQVIRTGNGLFGVLDAPRRRGQTARAYRADRRRRSRELRGLRKRVRTGRAALATPGW